MAYLTREELADFISPRIPAAHDSGSLGSDDHGDGNGNELPGPKNLRPSPMPTGGRPLQKASKARAGPSTVQDQPRASSAIMTPTKNNQQKQPLPRSQAPLPPLEKRISSATERIRRFSGEKIAGLSSRFAHAHRHHRRRGYSGSSSSSGSRRSSHSSRNSVGAGQQRQQHLLPSSNGANNKNQNLTVQRALNIDLDATLRGKMQPLERRIDELQITLPTATDFGIIMARLDALTAAFWAVHNDRGGEYSGHRTPTGRGSGLANGLPPGDRDGVSRIGRGPSGVGDDSIMDGLPYWNRAEVQRSGWEKGKGKGKQELVEEEEDLFISDL
ncbi:MAG: hypothetical protein OHK93_005024 [Ramalina farinacea]|uniref:Uncharacterized protein n=1 Tax=Ramalina farinacea TaxID=258253 RepID=A0AA43QV95_9LECA|nr:hypothetical protein [Ramalina farinacea]